MRNFLVKSPDFLKNHRATKKNVSTHCVGVGGSSRTFEWRNDRASHFFVESFLYAVSAPAESSFGDAWAAVTIIVCGFGLKRSSCGSFQCASRTAKGGDDGWRKFPFHGKVRRRRRTKKEVYKITENAKRPMRVFLL